MQHARLSPSASARWLTCTASVKVSEQYERTTNSASEWGTAVHGIGELLLLNKPIPDIVEGVEVDADMMKCAQEYVDYCLNLIEGKDSVTMIEEQFDLSFIAPNTFGTGDFTVLNGTHLHIVDLKTGHNIVKAEENPQLKLYALGAINELESIGYDVEEVTLHIVQSRVGHFDTWDTDFKALTESFLGFVNEQVDKILNDNTEFNPTEKGCKWCPHQANCEALKTHVESVVTGSFEDLTDVNGHADKISDSHLKSVLDNADLIVGFVNAVKEVALERLTQGQEIEGYKLVEGKSNRKWRDEQEVEAYLKKKRLKVDEMYDKKLKSMTKLLKLRPKDEELKSMLVKPAGKPQVAPENDKRPPLNIADEFDKC